MNGMEQKAVRAEEIRERLAELVQLEQGWYDGDQGTPITQAFANDVERFLLGVLREVDELPTQEMRAIKQTIITEVEPDDHG